MIRTFSGDIARLSETEQVDSSANSPFLYSGIVWIEFQLGQRLYARRLDSCLGLCISTRQMSGKCFKLENDCALSLTSQCVKHERLHHWCYKHSKLLDRHKTKHENVNNKFNVHGSVLRKYILIYIQQDATLNSLFISGNCCTCFGWYLRPSSGAHTTISTASGTCQTVIATCRYK